MANVGTFNPKEVATLSVNGVEHKTWESVWIQARWKESFSFFRFTAAEVEPQPPYWQDLPVKPCDRVVILLGGAPVITGDVVTRQVAYDATRHQVMIIGKSATWAPFKSSVDAKTGNFDGMTLLQIANKLLNPYDVGVKTKGDKDRMNEKFDHAQAGKGELIWEFLDKLARNKEVLLTADPFGNALLIGKHYTPPSAVLKEGYNIKKCQCTISIEDMWAKIQAVGQSQGSDDKNGPAAGEQVKEAKGSNCVKTTLVIPMEEPSKDDTDLEHRAHFEATWTDGSFITANITVQGWFPDGSNDPWEPGTSVSVFSPTALLNQVLAVQSVTFTQDNENGTETTLECVSPKRLNNGLDLDIGNPFAALPNAAKAANVVDTGRPTTSIPVGPETTAPGQAGEDITPNPTRRG